MEIPTEQLAALERWVVREFVHLEFARFMRNPDFETKEELVPWLFDQLLQFPAFRGNVEEIRPLLKELFLAATATSTPQQQSNASFLRTFVTPLVSGPILSACRAVRQANEEEDNEAIPTNNPAAETAASLLYEIASSSNSLDALLEELTCAHAVSELRPSLQHWVRQIEQELTVQFAQGFPPAMENFVVDQLPRKTMMAMLKSHSTSSATSCAMKFLFFRLNANTPSFFQQAVGEALLVNKMEQDLANVPLSEQVKLALHSGELPVADSDDCPHAVRYLELLARRKRADRLMQLCTDKQVVALLTRLMNLTKANTMDLFFAKGSGVVHLVQDLFTWMDLVIATKRVEHTMELDRVWMRVLALIHNVLLTQGDSNSLIRDTVNWYFEWFKMGLDLKLNWQAWLTECNVEDYNSIALEAKRCFEREIHNNNTITSANKIPRPTDLHASTRVLVPLLGNALMEATRGNKPKQSAIEKPIQQQVRSSGGNLYYLEVLFLHSENDTWSNLSKRRFVQCGYSKSTSIWARFEEEESLLRPIVEIRLITTDHFIPTGFTLLPKNLNKGAISGDKLFLCYRRQQQCEEEPITGLEILFTGADERKKLALKSCGYRVVETFSSGVFASSQIWMAGGSNNVTQNSL